MVKITSDLISRCAQYLNAVKEFQLDLRSYKISIIENLSATNDQFSCIDLSDNSISKIDSLPKLTRLRTLMIINNRISSIEKDFAINCPNLENLILTNNKITNIEEIDNLCSCKSIVRLSLVDNLITKIKFYRLYVIYNLPNLRVLDFQQVKNHERQAAKDLFTTEKGKELIENLKNKKYKEEDQEFVKAIEEIKRDDKINEAISNMIQKITNYEDLVKAEEKIKSGEMFQKFQSKVPISDSNNNIMEEDENN